jgi:hypothetical protein
MGKTTARRNQHQRNGPNSPSPESQSQSRTISTRECTGAGEGNRTLVVSLEGFCSTIELHPPDIPDPIRRAPRGAWWRRLDSNQRRRKPTDLQSAPFSHSGTPPRRTRNYPSFDRFCQTGVATPKNQLLRPPRLENRANRKKVDGLARVLQKQNSSRKESVRRVEPDLDLSISASPRDLVTNEASRRYEYPSGKHQIVWSFNRKGGCPKVSVSRHGKCVTGAVLHSLRDGSDQSRRVEK